MFNSHAARAMAGFTVDQWQTGVLRDLVAVNRLLEVGTDFVVYCGSVQAVFITDVIGIEIPDQDGFVIPDRCNRLR